MAAFSLNTRVSSTRSNIMEEGKCTTIIYTLIKEKKFEECIKHLNDLLLIYGQSKPILSLLAHCSYMIGNFVAAADCYEQLCSNLYPEVPSYRFYYAQSLYQAGLLEEAYNVTRQIDCEDLKDDIRNLQAAIKYRQDDFHTAEKLLTDKSIPDTVDSLVNLGCINFKLGKYDEALEKFNRATLQVEATGKKPPILRVTFTDTADREDVSSPRGCECGCETGIPEVRYNVLLCKYMTREYVSLLRSASIFVANACKAHSELAVGLNADQNDDMSISSVGNSDLLRRTALIEVFNIVAATHYIMKNMTVARKSLAEMPPRSESELDPITLHNLALLYMDSNPNEGFEKLQFLLQQTSFPSETFSNLLTLYIKYEFIDVAADVLAQNYDFIEKYLTQYQYDFFEAVVLRQTSPPESYSKFDTLAGELVKMLRNCAKFVGQKRQANDGAAVKKYVSDFDDLMNMYLPVLMQQCKIYWDRENYTQTEKLLFQAFDLCKNEQCWRINLGHVMFMQKSYEDAVQNYHSVVTRNFDQIFELPAIVVANLCVCYVMLGKREQAESMIERIEEAEKNHILENPETKLYHSCIIHLVLGTMYCVRDNFDFGIKHIISKLSGCISGRLCTETWFYFKRCLLALILQMAKRLILPNDYFIDTVVFFLSGCEEYGRTVKAHLDVQTFRGHEPNDKNLVCHEARLLKCLLLQLTY